MNSFITKSDTRHYEAKKASNPHYLPHEAEPTDFYQKYKDDNYLPMSGRSNIRNLFDDLDVKDYYWFRMVRKHLRKN